MMRRLIALACIVLFGASLFANTVITLKDGRVIEGEVYRVLANGDLCVHKTDGNDILIVLADIASRTTNNNTLTKLSVRKSAKQPANLPGFGLKISYIHGFNSTTVSEFTYLGDEEYLAARLSNGNGIAIGLSYTLNFNQYFYFEPGLQLSVLHYNLETVHTRTYLESTWGRDYLYTDGYSYDGYSNFFGFEIPALFGYKRPVGNFGDWTFKLGPALTVYRDFDDDSTNLQIGIQAETGIKFRKNHYVGIGFTACCLSGVSNSYNTYFYNYLKAKRHRLSLTYAYYF